MEYFFLNYYKSLCFFAHSFVKDKDTAEEITQDAFIRLWQAGDMERSEAALKNFLYTIVRNASIDYLRKQKNLVKKSREYEFLSQQETGEYMMQQMVAAETMQEIRQAVAALPEGCRQVLVHLFEKGEKLQKTAEVLNISINTVKSQRARGLQLIRKKLKITSP